MKPRRIIAGALLALFLWALCMGFIALFFNAMDREQAALKELRIERCARMGEKIPKQLEQYCSDLGV